MRKIKLKFSKRDNTNFYKTLRNRVNQYFQQNNLPKYGGKKMVLKTILYFALYFVPFILMLASVITNPYLIILSWIIMGLGEAGIGMGVMHDANHGSYSKRRIINRLMGYSLNLLGGNSKLWQVQHNEKHHIYTNVDGYDDDINRLPLLRFSPRQKWAKMYKIQFIYAWFLYSLNTLLWKFIGDFLTVVRHNKNGRFKNKKSFAFAFSKLVAWKILYIGYILVLPMILLPVSPWLVLACFIFMHLISGTILSVIFQTAHVFTESEFPEPDPTGSMENNWAIHQLKTTTNFSTSNRFLTWLIGGLNFQVEHHLFANISHVHYPKISKIVAATAKEFGLQYQTHKYFWSAVIDHGSMLRKLGMKQYPS